MALAMIHPTERRSRHPSGRKVMKAIPARRVKELLHEIAVALHATRPPKTLNPDPVGFAG